MLKPELICAIRRQYRLPWRGIHGITHWARVLENGLRLAPLTGARAEIIWLFAVFHDACRHNENWDPEHGLRGANLAASLRGTMFQLPDADFALLHTACAYHTSAKTHDDITVQTCWDADRLDLGRVHICPNPKRLCTEAAKDPQLIAWAHQRSRANYEPEILAHQWAVD